jgi:acyl carrier protein
VTREEIFGELRHVMSELFGLEADEILLESRLVEDLDLDSIDAIDLVVKMNELGGEKMDQDEMRRIHTVGDIVGFIEARLLRARRGGPR